MRLFSADLLRNFGIGFALGAVLVVSVNAREWGVLATPAQAAEASHASAPALALAPGAAADFALQPEGH